MKFEKKLKYLPLPPDTEHKLGKTGLCVWLNSPAGYRDLHKLAATLDMVETVIGNQKPSRATSRLLQDTEQYSQAFYEMLSRVMSAGAETTRFTIEELSRLSEVVGKDAADEILSSVLSALPRV